MGTKHFLHPVTFIAIIHRLDVIHLSQYIREAYGHEERKGHPRIVATSGYVAVPERFDQNEDPACSNEERTRKKPSFVLKKDLIDAIVF